MDSKFESVLNGPVRRKSMQNRNKQNISMLNAFHSLSLQIELENECDHRKAFWDLETLAIKWNKEQMFETIINEIIQNENERYEFKHSFKNDYPFLPDNLTLCKTVLKTNWKFWEKSLGSES